MAKEKVGRLVQRCSLTMQFPAQQGVELDDLSERFGISRHRLLHKAIQAGMPLIVAELENTVLSSSS